MVMMQLLLKQNMAASDTRIYTFYGVKFESGDLLYHYLSNDETLMVGERVIVLVGNNNQEVVVEIVTIEKHKRTTAPYPVDQTKFIKRKYLDND